MKPLLRSLQHFSKSSFKHVELFRQLQLRDLGFYVSDSEASRYMQDNTYPLATKAFALQNSLYQCRYDPATSAFVPRAWKATADDAIGCSTLYQDDAVTLCWFVIPPGRALPLHDHPGMTVWQRVMHGRLHVCTFACDAAPAAPAAPDAPLTAAVTFAGEVEGKDGPATAADLVSFGAGDGGVLHEIRNVHPTQPALFVDIIAPPYYQSPSNIPCGYYTAKLLETSSADPRRALSDLPSDCGVRSQLAKGDRVQLHPRPGFGGPAMNAYVYLNTD